MCSDYKQNKSWETFMVEVTIIGEASCKLSAPNELHSLIKIDINILLSNQISLTPSDRRHCFLVQEKTLLPTSPELWASSPQTCALQRVWDLGRVGMARQPEFLVGSFCFLCLKSPLKWWSIKPFTCLNGGTKWGIHTCKDLKVW